MRVVGVIPAAGWGTRLGLTAGSKEMVEVGGRPVLDYLVDRMRAASATQLRIVTRAEKTDVIVHADQLDVEVILGEPANTGESIELGIADLDDHDIVLIGFPDSIWEPVDGYQLLLDQVVAGADGALGLFNVIDPEFADVVVISNSGRVEQILIKPSPAPSPLIWACAALRRPTLDGVGSYEYPGQLLDRLSATKDLRGVWLSDDYIDIGTPASLHEARRKFTPPAR